MGLSKIKIKLLKYIQEAGQISLDKCAHHFEKDEITIRREIQSINEFNSKPIIKIKKSICYCTLNYDDYLKVIKQLTNYDYFSSYEERVKVVLCTIFFKGYANTSDLYQQWNMSLTTKKNDMVKFREIMTMLGMKVDIIRKKGLTIQGSEILFRIYAMNQIYSLFEIKEDNTIYERIANTPLEHQIFQMIDTNFRPYIKISLHQIKTYLEKENILITYNSKKMLLLFLCSLYYRPPKEDRKKLKELPFPFAIIDITSNDYFNNILGVLFTILDLSTNTLNNYELDYINKCNIFIEQITDCLTSPIYTRELLNHEIYDFINKQIARNYLHATIKDKLVKNVDKKYPILYEIIKKRCKYLQDNFYIEISESAIFTLTLIFQKHMMKNDLYDEDKSKLIIVTGIPFERLSFFQQQLTEYFNFTIVSLLNLNSLSLIDTLNYDYIITFSERTYNIVKSKYKHTILTNFFIDSTEAEKLSIYGIKKKKTKLNTKKLLDTINNISSQSEKEQYLKDTYPEIFI